MRTHLLSKIELKSSPFDPRFISPIIYMTLSAINLSTYQNHNNLLREYKACRDHILRIITERCSPPQAKECIMCHRKSSMEWRCHACFGEPTFCTTCLRSTHRSRPFHKVSKWSGRCFEPSTLLEADVTLNLCHNGELCPEYGNTVRKYDER